METEEVSFWYITFFPSEFFFCLRRVMTGNNGWVEWFLKRLLFQML